MGLDEQEKRDLLRILSHAFDEEDLDGLVFLDIQKIFYYLRKRLDDSNRIKSSLQYYWYIDGCMSDTVKQAVDWGVQNGVLIDSPTERTQEGTWYQIDHNGLDTEVAMSDDLKDAFDKLEVVLSDDYNLFDDYETKIKRLYQEAPLDFQEYFKTELLWLAEDLAEGDMNKRQMSDMSSKVMLAESYLPLSGQYTRFNEVYSRYSTISQKYLDKIDGEHSGLRIVFASLTTDIWKLFCKQLRIYEHDPYYDDQVTMWQSEYDEMENNIKDTLSSFDRMINIEFESDGIHEKPSESEGWGPVARAYLSGTQSQSD